MKSRGSVVYSCPRCGSPLRRDGGAGVVDGGELVVPCTACGAEGRVPLGGVPPEERDAPGPDAAAPAPELPPFRDLVTEADAPPFDRLAEPKDAVKPRTLLDRWHALSPGRQQGVVAAVVVGVIAWVVLRPTASEAFPPRPPQPEPPPVNIVAPAPSLTFSPPPQLQKYLVTARPIPLNTEITPGNAAEFFRYVEVAPGDAGAAVTSPDRVFGKYARRDLAAGQFVTHELFGGVSLAPAPRVWKPELVTTRVHTASGVTDYVFEKTADGYRQVSPNPSAPVAVNGGAP